MAPEKPRKPCPVCKTTDHRLAEKKGYLCSPCAVKRSEEWMRNNLEKYRLNQIVSKYNITKEEYLEKVGKQGNRCKICLQHETDRHHKSNKLKELAVDHSHKTGAVRDLLCKKCNTALGLIKEDKAILQNMINYLEQHNE